MLKKKNKKNIHKNVGCPQCLLDLNENSYIFMEFFLCFSLFPCFSKDLYIYILNVKLRKQKIILTAKVESGEANVSYSIEDGDTESC